MRAGGRRGRRSGRAFNSVSKELNSALNRRDIVVGESEGFSVSILICNNDPFGSCKQSHKAEHRNPER